MGHCFCSCSCFDEPYPPSFRDGPKDQTSDVQLHIGESRDSGFAFCAPRNDGAVERCSRSYHSSPCTFGISCVGWICGAAGFASTVAGATTCGGVCGLAGLACTAADCCVGAGAGSAASGVDSPLRGGAALGIGTDGVPLATCGIDAGGRGGPRTALTGGSDPTAP